MGVPQVWELLKPHIKDKRVPLRKFAADFKSRNGSPVRIAIDGYTWLYECGFFSNQESPEKFAGQGQISKTVLNLMHRLKELLSLDISFILVFDGEMKPWFKNNFRSNDELTNVNLSEDYFSNWQEHLRSHKEFNTCLKANYVDDSTGFMRAVKLLLDTMKISYIEACGEGEAQCAWLQKNGYVDYALSNDSDTLIFGSTKMLRNYSKAIDDFGVTGVGSHRPEVRRDTKETFITVVELDDIRESTTDRYEWWTLLFFSILLGADYNQGIKGLGKTKSARLAQLRDPDFAAQFRHIFGTIENPFEPEAREVKYKTFQEKVLKYCSENSVKLFGRNYKAFLSKENMEGWPSQTAVMYYFHPYLVPDLDRSFFDSRYVNMSENLSYQDIQFEKLQAYLSDIHLSGVTHFKRWYTEAMQESFVLRHLLNDGPYFYDEMKITEEKTFFGNEDNFQYSCWKVRYNDFLDLFPDSQSPLNQTPFLPHGISTKRRADTLKFKYSVWIPKGLFPESHWLVKLFKEETKLKGSPKKSPKRSPKRSPQKNTLDSFLSAHSSPINETKSTTTPNVPVLEPVKRRLFVETDVEENDTVEDEGDSSLIFLSESKVTESQRSPSAKTFWDLTVDEEQDSIESPQKRQRLSTEKSNN